MNRKWIAYEVVAKLRALLAEVAASGVEYNDPRVDYVVVQIDRGVWKRIQDEAHVAAGARI